ncbi:MAG: histidine kinase [Phaeodactylibacter sp.]|uniref:sensor histidine kinase n=1 Tax=Phaeodactylibacter sp. TaxID=1940289 RepID=UPI0032EC7010
MKPHWLHIGLCLLLHLLCRAQDASYIQYTTEDGLPTNYVYGVVEDDDGYIWAYTENGLAKFDGYGFEHFTLEDGLPGNDIPFAEKGPDGRIWLFSIYNRPAYVYQDSIVTVHEEGCVYMGVFNGAAYYGCKSGYYAYRDRLIRANYHEYDPSFVKQYAGLFEQTEQPEQLTEQFVYGTATYFYTLGNKGQRQWYRSSGIRRIPGHPYYYNIDASTFIVKRPSGLWGALKLEPRVDNRAIQVCQIPGKEQFLIRGHKSGVFWIAPLAFTYRYIDPVDYGIHPKAHLSVSMLQDRLWISTDDGALCFDFEGHLLEKVQNRTLSERYFLHRTYSDSRGNIWIGSRDGGLFLIPQANKGVHKRQLPKGGDQHLEALLRTRQGQIIGITANTGVYQITKDTVRSLTPAQKSRRFRSVVPTPQGVYISSSSRNFLLQEQAGKLRTIDAEDYFTLINDSNYAYYLKAGDQDLAFHAEENALYGLRSGYLTKMQLMPSGRDIRAAMLNISSISIQKVYYNPHARQLYVSSVNGLERLVAGVLKPVLSEGESLRGISALFGTPGKLWIGTESEGLFYYDLGSKNLARIAAVKMVRQIKADGERGVLVACNDGVLAVPFEAPKDYTQYTVRHGLPTNEIEDVLAKGDSMLYIASAQGLHELKRFFETSSEVPDALLQLTAVSVKGQPVPVSDLDGLSHLQNDLSFDYSLRSYASDGNIRYCTRLEPLETEWEESRERQVNYLELSPGDYTFYLKAKDIYGTEVLHEPVTIHIAKAFWQEWWFRILCLLTFAGVVGLLALQRIRRERRKQEAKRTLEKRIANLELDALKAQMNPHFIFNALGAIQYFIQTQDVDSADNYLTMFARLMRKYLDSAREKMIPLEQEIALLRDYTALEKMRFEDLFEVEIELEEGLDPSEYLIPSMLLQPFVENAINHGLSERRDKRGLIRIQFNAQGDTLICRIEDNGIGREQAKSKRRKGHRSRGMKIVQEKMETLRTSGIADIRIEVEEAFPHNTEYPGTLVTIQTKPLDHE